MFSFHDKLRCKNGTQGWPYLQKSILLFTLVCVHCIRISCDITLVWSWFYCLTQKISHSSQILHWGELCLGFFFGGLQESMKMMGLHNWLHWTAWFFRYWLQLTLSVLVMTVLFSISLGDQGAVLKNSNPVLIFIYLELYAMASISLAFLLSTFFKKGIVSVKFLLSL